MKMCCSWNCKEEAHPNPESKGFCGECWLERVEHTAYERRWYAYWNARGKNYIPKFQYPQFAGVI